MARQDPLRNFRFRLEIDSTPIAGFSEVEIGAATTDAIDYREGTDPPHARKLSGLTKYGNIVLKRGMVVGATGLDLFKWWAEVSAGQLATQRRKIAIIVQDEAGIDQARFVVSEAWPVKWQASYLKADANDVIIETLELVNEGVERIK